MAFEHISKDWPKSFEELKKSSSFEKGLKDFKEGTVLKLKSIEPIFVKKLITQRDWNRIYKYNSIYCNLGIEGVGRGRRVKIGFVVVAGYIPDGCELCSNEELRQINEYQQAHQIYPHPLKKLENENQ